jgi:EAL domain-containing protein (putative c-di-GMP-specific phosphodiesterase class I)
MMKFGGIATRLRGPGWLLLAAALTVASSAFELLVMRETGLSSLLRPASGILFIVALCLGWQGIAAALTFLAVSYLTSVTIGFPLTVAKPISTLAIVTILASVGAQAELQARLFRWFDLQAPLRLHRFWAVLLVAPLGSLVAPTVMTVVLNAQGAILNLPPSRLWIVSYVGNMLGIGLIFPLAWVLDRQRQLVDNWREQLPLTAVSMLLVGAVWFALWGIQSASLGDELRKFRERSAAVAQALERELDRFGMVATGLQMGVQSEVASTENFSRLSQELLGRVRTLDAVMLLQRVTPAEQAAFEQSLSVGGPQRRIHVWTETDTAARPAMWMLERPEWVVERAEPAAAALRWIGVPFSREPEALDLDSSLSMGDTGVQHAPLVLQQADNLLTWIVPLSTARGASLALVLAQRPETLIKAAIDSAGGLAEGGGVILTDISTQPEHPVYYGDSSGAPTSREAAYSVRPNGTLRDSVQLAVFDRLWRLEILLPTNSALSFTNSWWINQIAVHVLGMALSALLVLVADRRRAAREMEAQVSALSQRYREFDRPREVAPIQERPAQVSTISLDIELTRRDGLLAEAFRRSEFCRYYEPIVNLATGRIIGFESLLRWPEAPEPFTVPQIIDWAERTGVIHRLTLEALNEAVELVELWRASASSGTLAPWIAVNVSPEDIGRPEFTNQIVELIRRHPMARNRIKLEITEGVLVRDLKNTAQRLRGVRSEGIGIALDDFGTGYSSLSYLHQLPVDSIKIDRSFIGSLSSEPQGRDIVQATVELGQRLQIDVVAEGIEDLHTIGLLRRYGCHAGQGYLFSRARPSSVIDEWVRAGRRFEFA